MGEKEINFPNMSGDSMKAHEQAERVDPEAVAPGKEDKPGPYTVKTDETVSSTEHTATSQNRSETQTSA